jgi:hypothetical protein
VIVWSALFTVCDTAADCGLALKLLSPPYVAVIECDPTLKEDVANVACPDPSSVPVPRVVAPSLNVTIPVGVPLPGEFTVTVAVNVTNWLNAEGFAPELTAVVVFALLTVNV